MLKQVITAVVVGVIVFVAAALVFDKEKTAGAVVGPDVTEQMFFRGGLVTGGNCYNVATTGTAYTLPAAILDYGCVTVMANGASLALTLPATSTLNGRLPAVGDTKTIIVRHATTTANILMTFAGGTGTTLKRASTTTLPEILGDTDAANYAELTFTRRATGYVDVMFHSFVD